MTAVPREPSGEADKTAWRRWARAVRASLDPATVSARVTVRLAEWLPLLAPTTVLTFLPMGDEIDLQPLAAGLPHIRWAITRTPGMGGLTVHLLGGSLERHRFGFLQPVAGAPALDPAEVDVALVPGLAFDRRGGRLGRGAGYFDGLLPSLRPDALRVGVAPAAVVVDRLPVDEHDVPMTHLATEDGVAAIG